MSSLQHKMQNYEVVPPSHTWDKIAAALDESELQNEYPHKLYNAELIPPANAWENISAGLAVDEPKVIPMPKRRNGFIRYAAAAVLIGLAAFGVIRWMTSGTAGTNSNDPAVVSAPPPATTDPKIATPPPSVNDASIEKEIAATTEQGTTRLIVRAEQPVRNRSANNRTIASAGYIYSSEAVANDQYTNPLYAYVDHLPNLSDRYITLMTPEGTLIRMAKKWSNLVCCVSGEEQDADCKSQLKKWQEKLATSPLAPSPGNFMDILNMVSSLDDAGTEL
jgi:hypothetical protein